MELRPLGVAACLKVGHSSCDMRQPSQSSKWFVVFVDVNLLPRRNSMKVPRYAGESCLGAYLGSSAKLTKEGMHILYHVSLGAFLWGIYYEPNRNSTHVCPFRLVHVRVSRGYLVMLYERNW